MIVIVRNHGLEHGMKVLEDEMKIVHINTQISSHPTAHGQESGIVFLIQTSP